MEYVILDNFLGPRANQMLLSELEHLELTAGTVNDHGVEHVTDLKRNANTWITDLGSNVSMLFRSLMFVPKCNPESMQVIENRQTKPHDIMISRYNNGDYYNWHTDLGGFVTWNYIAFREPKEFTGGNFLLSKNLVDDPVPTEYETIECVNDRLIIFPSKYQHSVTPLVGGDNNPRYTVQVFFR